jgi:hypothetical protein
MTAQRTQNILTACLTLALVGTLFQNCAQSMPNDPPAVQSNSSTGGTSSTGTPLKAVYSIGTAMQTANISTIGGAWTDIPGLALAFTLSEDKTVHMSAMGSVTWVQGSQATGHCGFRFMVNTSGTGDATWGDRIIQVYNWSEWSIERDLPLTAGTYAVKVQQTGWSGTNAGCASNTNQYSAAHLSLTAY